MPLITHKQHPASVAVVDATGMRSMKKLAGQVRALLDDPCYTSVVVLRDTHTLPESFKRAARNRKIAGDASDLYYFDKGMMPEPLFSKRKDRRYLKEEYGPDYFAFANFISYFGAGQIAFRGNDGVNGGAHLDSSNATINTPRGTVPCLPAGITATMAAGGGSTQIVEAGRDEFEVEQDDRDKRLSVWKWKNADIPVAEEKVWSVPEGAFTVMKSKGWLGQHLPCVHRSPPRKENGNQRERNVAVAFLDGRNGRR